MKIAFSWDDGALEDCKLFELHEKYKVPGMFFVPTYNREGRDVLSPEMIKKGASRYVKFGGHTENHTYLTDIPIESVESEILDNKKYLENILGEEGPHFCLPGGKYNSEVLNIIYKHFKTIRTADTMNFRYNGGLLKPTFHLYPRGKKSLLGNCRKNNSYKELFYIGTHLNKNYFQIIRDLINQESKNENSIIMVWGHSWEIEEQSLWDEVEKILKMKVVQKNKCSYDEIFRKVENK